MRLTIIKNTTGWASINIGELWAYRELFYIFAWRDIKVRYKQTVIGVLWAVLQPILLMVIFSTFFGGLAKIPSEGVPYPVFVFSGLLYWNYFSTSLTGTSNSLIDNENILKKIYFPRLVLSLSPSLTPMIDFIISLVVLFGIMLYYGTTFHLSLLVLPIVLLLAFLAASGLGMFLAALNVRYRDIRYALPFFIQSLLFLTPVIYPTTLIPEQYRWILSLNPMTGIIEAARASITGAKPLDIELLGLSALISLLLFTIGIFYFRKTERFFADIA